MANAEVQFMFADPASQWKGIVQPGGGTGTAGLCSPYIKLIRDGHGDVTLDGTPAPAPYGGQGWYEGPTAHLRLLDSHLHTLEFTVIDGAGQVNQYFLGGMALQDATLLLNRRVPPVHTFPEIKVVADPKTLQTRLSLVDQPGSNVATYRFYVLVQNADSEIGLIDPRITNL